jgi:hypothetical protein
MAFFTFLVSMGSVEREKVTMIKISQSVNTIVAIQAARSKLQLVFGHKAGIFSALRMTGYTNIQTKQPDVALMAVFTDKLTASLCLQMTSQTEPGGLGVIKRFFIPDSWHPA